MPSSKRDKKVSLTKTTKKGKERKNELIENIRKHVEDFENLFVFTVDNVRNGPLKEVRENWKGSRFFFAKKKIMAIALGRTEACEAQKNLHKLAKTLNGQCGLLFTNKPKDYVVEWFENFSKMDFAKSGFVATKTVTLPAGPLPDFSHALEPHLRSLGLPTKLEKGVVVLREEHTVCTEGARLKPEEASILKLLGCQMAEFKMSLLCMWSKDGSFDKFKTKKHKLKMEVCNAVDEVLKKKHKVKKDKSNHTKEGTVLEENITNLSLDEESKKKNKKNKDKSNHTKEEIVVQEDNTNKSLSEVSKNTNKDKSNHFEEPEENVDEKNIINQSPDEVTATEENGMTTDSELNSGKEAELLKKETKTLRKTKTPKKCIAEQLSDEIPMDVDAAESVDDPTSPHFNKTNPRRSMRTPKPIKRTPEQLKQSVKKLTVSASKIQRTPRGTPKKSKAIDN